MPSFLQMCSGFTDKTKGENMTEYERIKDIVRALRAEGGCPWDREQTHMSLKPACIEEAAEVICGINILDETGNPDNLMEELGDLLLQVLMHAQIAEEEGLFNMEDVCRCIADKMIRRHPHVFGDTQVDGSAEVLRNWDKIKAREKQGKEWMDERLPAAFEEAKELVDRAAERKRKKKEENRK
ncbi:MAG: MazG family protein [Lachnospiraceae bacterium]|nr:MazG family protein [Lachnospiraceae bacterium]